MDAHTEPCLILDVGERSTSVVTNDEDLRFTLGKDEHNDLVYGGELTSRYHARIERAHKDFYLVDCSTNGTYVQTEDEQVTRVHRGKVKLWGEGWLCLGAPLHIGQPIHFRQG